jgi:hypothetical protein
VRATYRGMDLEPSLEQDSIRKRLKRRRSIIGWH